MILRSGTPLVPRLFGGHQERDFRPGTEPVSLAAGMALALKLWEQHQHERHTQMSSLRDRLEAGVTRWCAPVVVNGTGAHRLPNTSSIAFPGCEADALLIALDLEGICCSHGSACSSGSTAPAPVLGAMGLPVEVQRSTLRFSLSFLSTPEEIDLSLMRIAKVVNRLRNHSKSSRLN